MIFMDGNTPNNILLRNMKLKIYVVIQNSKKHFKKKMVNI